MDLSIGDARTPPPPAGRERQRRRTRKAILDATVSLLASGRDPSIGEIAEAADVSRRTVYLHFATLEQLLIDATVGAMTDAGFDDLWNDAALADDVEARVEAVTRWVCRQSCETLHLGRRLIRLTIDATQPPSAGSPPRGYRRLQWIEQAISPLQGRLDAADLDDLASSLSLVIGWEALIILRDIRNLDDAASEAIIVAASRALLRDALGSLPSTPDP